MPVVTASWHASQRGKRMRPAVCNCGYRPRRTRVDEVDECSTVDELKLAAAATNREHCAADMILSGTSTIVGFTISVWGLRNAFRMMYQFGATTAGVVASAVSRLSARSSAGSTASSRRGVRVAQTPSGSQRGPPIAIEASGQSCNSQSPSQGDRSTVPSAMMLEWPDRDFVREFGSCG